MRSGALKVALVCVLLAVVGTNANYIVGGYFPNWAPYLSCHGLPVSSFNVGPYTHIWYAFGSVSTSNWAPSAGGDENGGILTQLVNLKSSHPNLHVLISFGGGGQSDFFYGLAGNENNRQKFISQVIPWLRRYNLDGLDLDWEFPSGNDAQNFATLLAELRTAINAEHASSGKPALILTIAGYGDKQDLGSWPIAQMAQSLDWFNIMTYEEHGPWDSNTPTGINAPINSDDGYDLAGAVQGYRALGVPGSKILLGAPTFAHSFKLADPSKTYIGAPGAGAGPQGQCTQSAGDLAYWEVKTLISQGATVVWDPKSQTPYLYKGNTWVSYENPQSFAAKAQLAVSNNLLGLFVWDIDEDDNNELINAAAAVFTGNGGSSTSGGSSAAAPPSSGYLQSKSNGKYVTLDSNSILVASATSTSSATRFTFTQNEYGYTIKAAQFVSADNYGWNPLVGNRPTASTWESFVFTQVGSAWQISAYINNNFVAVQSNGQLQATQANSGSIPSSAQFAIV